MFQYDACNDQYIEVDLEEFSSDEEDVEESPNVTDTIRSINPLLVIRKQKRQRKIRSSNINYFNLTRIIRKSGRLNTFLSNLPHKKLNYMIDLGNTLLNLRWRWILITLYLVNFSCFILFSWLWMFLAKISGDFDGKLEGDEKNTSACIVEARTFTGYLLLSIETMTTIGYGFRYPTEHCTGGWFLILLQALFSIFVQGALVSAVYVKTSKPFLLRSSSLFSKRAVICLRDGKLSFVFRIHDFSKQIYCGTNICLYFVDKEQTHLDSDFEMVQMKVQPHGLLIFPLEIEHVMDEDSPLWKFRPLEILKTRFEIVAVAEGSSTITGQVSQKRTSYSNSDIMWGHRFKPCVHYDEVKQSFIVDYKEFKQTVPFDTPLCSARKLAEIQRRFKEYFEQQDGAWKYRDGNNNKAESLKALTPPRVRKISYLESRNEKNRLPEVFYNLFNTESVANFQDFQVKPKEEKIPEVFKKLFYDQ